MKKIIIAAFIVATSLQASRNEELIEMFKMLKKESSYSDVNVLKFVLCNERLDAHLYPHFAVAQAKNTAQSIHERVSNIVADNQGDLEVAGKSLDKNLDAPIVNQCAILEQCIRATGKAGTVKGKNPLALFGFSGNYNGSIFYENACPSDFYKKLSDKQLEQLEKNTR